MHYDLIPSRERTGLDKESALELFLQGWTHHDTLHDLGPVLTCAETEQLCDLLAAHGHHDAADVLRAAHIVEDDGGDLNHNTGQEFTEAELVAAGYPPQDFG